MTRLKISEFWVIRKIILPISLYLLETFYVKKSSVFGGKPRTSLLVAHTAGQITVHRNIKGNFKFHS